MELLPREIEGLLIFCSGMVAKQRLERELRLNHPEAVAYISATIMEQAREGKSVEELMEYGTKILRRSQLLEGIPEMINRTGIMVQATFDDGARVVSISKPISQE
ncbi:urease subunit gamma [Pseudomonas chlororaphis]|uniref:Urease subunit gamma n=1 Tax=Pseudomonas chlororaphis TaxID=587753 RepID=A0A1Q8EV21_9PSED|nr:urease subunit gamma [Pseudomonas chlororaphis]OLF55634.1 urease subunit gamma [Pseudomonas chlororaphis]